MTSVHLVDPQPLLAGGDAISDWAGVRVGSGHTVKTGYVLTEDVVIQAQQHQLAPAAVERAYCRQLELGAEQAWPPPTGYWRDDGRFVLTDGRHRLVAALMLGMRYMLVAWLSAPVAPCPRCEGAGFDGHGEPCQICGDDAAR